jgi:aminoglycoside 6'-N-acetyltransferase I
MTRSVDIQVRLLNAGEERILTGAVAGVFDGPVDANLAVEFLADPRHHIAVALDGEQLVGFASAVHYVHPDKPVELWVNEVAVSPSYHRLGIGRRLLSTLLDAARAIGCRQAWVLTDRANTAAMQLYHAVGGVEASGDTVMFEFAITHSSTARDLA